MLSRLLLRLFLFFANLIFDLSVIPRNEYLVFFITGLMLFFIALNYALLRKLKDIIIGLLLCIECITFIKLLIFPIILFITSILMYFSNKTDDKEKFINNICRWGQAPFILYFSIYLVLTLFGGVEIFQKLSPNIDLRNVIVTSFEPFNVFLWELSLLINNFWHVFLAILTEIYCVLMLSYAFWSLVSMFSNALTIKRRFTQYIICSSGSVAVSGVLGMFWAYVLKNIFGCSLESYNRYSTAINLSIIIFSMFMAILCHSIIIRENSRLNILANINTSSKNKKVKLTFVQSITTIFSNRNVICIFIGVLSYMASMNVIESLLKKVIVNLCKTQENPRYWFDNISSLLHLIIGLFTVCSSRLCLYTFSRFGRYGWLVTSLINPITLYFSAIIFISLFCWGGEINLSIFKTGLKVSALVPAVIIGLYNNAASKATKYACGDPAKEVVYRELDTDIRTQSKAAVDMPGGRFGKFIAALLQQLMIALSVKSDNLHHGQEAIAKYVLVILTLIFVIWIISIFVLDNNMHQNDEIEEYTNNKEAEGISETTSMDSETSK